MAKLSKAKVFICRTIFAPSHAKCRMGTSHGAADWNDEDVRISGPVVAECCVHWVVCFQVINRYLIERDGSIIDILSMCMFRITGPSSLLRQLFEQLSAPEQRST